MNGPKKEKANTTRSPHALPPLQNLRPAFHHDLNFPAWSSNAMEPRSFRWFDEIVYNVERVSQVVPKGGCAD